MRLTVAFSHARNGLRVEHARRAAPAMLLWGQLQVVVSAALASGAALVVAGRAGAL